jgi:hypothetical protein
MAPLPLQTWPRQQLLAFANSVVALADWAIVRDFAAQMYGEGRAAEVKIRTHEEYDDENYSYPIGKITAYDKDGNELAFDHSLPFFRTKAWKDSEAGYKDYDDDYRDFIAFKSLAMSDKVRQRGNWVLFGDLPVESHDYDLTTPPQVSLEPARR